VQGAAFHPARNRHELTGDVAGELVRSEHDDGARDVLRLRDLRSAIVRLSRWTNSGSSSPRVIGEYVQPGATAFTRPRGAIRTISFLRLRSSPACSAAFAAA
jgi:hypothetical protein